MKNILKSIVKLFKKEEDTMEERMYSKWEWLSKEIEEVKDEEELNECEELVEMLYSKNPIYKPAYNDLTIKLILKRKQLNQVYAN